MLPVDLRRVYSDHMDEQGVEVRCIVKAADKSSALVKRLEKQKMGNRGFVSAGRSIQKYLGFCDLLEVEVFV